MATLPLETGLYRIDATRYYPWASAGSGGFVDQGLKTYKLKDGLVGHFSQELYDLRNVKAPKARYTGFPGDTSSGGAGGLNMGQYPSKDMIPFLVFKTDDNVLSFYLPNNPYFITYLKRDEVMQLTARAAKPYATKLASLDEFVKMPATPKTKESDVYSLFSIEMTTAPLERVGVFQPYYTKKAAQKFINDHVKLWRDIHNHNVRRAQDWAWLRNQVVGAELPMPRRRRA